MNAELVQKALQKVGHANTLINLISRRVRQLNSGGRPLGGSSVPIDGSMGMADIALLEIIDGRLGWEMPELAEWTPPEHRRSRSHKPVLKTPRAG